MRTGRPGTLRRPSSFSNEAGRKFREGRAAGNSHFGCARFSSPRRIRQAGCVGDRAARFISPGRPGRETDTAGRPRDGYARAGRAPAGSPPAGRAPAGPAGRISLGRRGVSVPAAGAYQSRPSGVSVPASQFRPSPGRWGYQSRPPGRISPGRRAYQRISPGRRGISPGRRD